MFQIIIWVSTKRGPTYPVLPYHDSVYGENIAHISHIHNPLIPIAYTIIVTVIKPLLHQNLIMQNDLGNRDTMATLVSTETCSGDINKALSASFPT